jgi:membrane-bound lytic murein transglycosylase B
LSAVRRAAACLLALAALSTAVPAQAYLAFPDFGALTWDQKLLNRIRADEASLALNKPDDAAYRAAVRDEQSVIYSLAADPDLEAVVGPQLPQHLSSSFGDALAALRALYRLAGIDQSRIKPRFSRSLDTPVALAHLVELYKGAGTQYGLDWTYLASINFIESDFGRVMGPSSAGALGPMQFMPSTWDNYGNGGDVMNPQDAIPAAARYLVHYGAPDDMSGAIWHYNHDDDYVAAVALYAQILRRDEAWLPRLYYWSTKEPGPGPA